MASNINSTIPVAGANLLAEPIRNNFVAVKAEIEALQLAVENSGPIDGIDTATDGQVLTATGLGTANWEDPATLNSGSLNQITALLNGAF